MARGNMGGRQSRGGGFGAFYTFLFLQPVFDKIPSRSSRNTRPPRTQSITPTASHVHLPSWTRSSVPSRSTPSTRGAQTCAATHRVRHQGSTCAPTCTAPASRQGRPRPIAIACGRVHCRGIRAGTSTRLGMRSVGGCVGLHLVWRQASAPSAWRLQGRMGV